MLKFICGVGCTLAMVLFLSSCMPGAGTGSNKQPKLQKETEHFLLYCEEIDLPAADEVARVLEEHYKIVTTHFQTEPASKFNVMIYPDLVSYHKAIGKRNAPDWVVGNASEKDRFQMVSPNNPGPVHSREAILKVAVHEFTHTVIMTINEQMPGYLNEGTAAYEAGQSEGVAALVQNGSFPTVKQLSQMGADEGLYQFGYAFVQYIVAEYGYQKLIDFIKTANFSAVFGCSEAEFDRNWANFLKDTYQAG